ncbi:MAG TPA: hypothetical protein DCE56_17315 [Cyanobacteria bacterium UBA8553]|nr:hypothetical protein [Cyanobacteria bacterium UBA8553]HAJ64611.1 hypothetical protein [Cyanobacteria bacterium UBA8543]
MFGRLATGLEKPSVSAYNRLNHSMIIVMNKDKTLKLKSRNHITFRLCYHLILTLKYRKNILTQEMQDRLKQIITTLLVKWESVGCAAEFCSKKIGSPFAFSTVVMIFPHVSRSYY